MTTEKKFYGKEIKVKLTGTAKVLMLMFFVVATSVNCRLIIKALSGGTGPPYKLNEKISREKGFRRADSLIQLSIQKRQQK